MDDIGKLLNGLDASGASPQASSSIAGLAQAVQAEGGLDGLTAKLRDAGMGDQVDSWIGSGPNEPIDPQ